MTDAPAKHLLSPETVRAWGAAAGLEIDPDRLPAVTDVLAELLDLAAQLAALDLRDVEPDAGDPRAGWVERP
jgi:hypothetical protein